jgi:hypothetical protein
VRKGGGKGKGSGFERDVAKQIVRAFHKFGIKQRECWRSVLSGGHTMSSGDLIMSVKLEKLFPYSVECKFYRKIDWWHFLVTPPMRNQKWKEMQWLAQAINGAKKRPDLKPLLIMKENRSKVFAMYQTKEKDSVYGWRLILFSDLLKRRVRSANANQ